MDDSGELLTQSDAISTTNPDDLIAQHVSAGPIYLLLEGTGGAGQFTLTTQQSPAVAPGQPISSSGTGQSLVNLLASITSVVAGDFQRRPPHRHRRGHLRCV